MLSYVFQKYQQIYCYTVVRIRYCFHQIWIRILPLETDIKYDFHLHITLHFFYFALS